VREDREETVFGRTLTPEQRPGGPSAGVLRLRRVLVALWLVVVAVQIVIWGVSVVVHGSFEFPWWIWSVGSGAVFFAFLWWITGTKSGNEAS
jgi:hypothetical protein